MCDKTKKIKFNTCTLKNFKVLRKKQLQLQTIEGKLLDTIPEIVTNIGTVIFHNHF